MQAPLFPVCANSTDAGSCGSPSHDRSRHSGCSYISLLKVGFQALRVQGALISSVYTCLPRSEVSLFCVVFFLFCFGAVKMKEGLPL